MSDDSRNREVERRRTPPLTRKSRSAIPAEEMARLTDEIVGALKTVFDPEIPADIYELGLIYKVDIDDDRMVNIDMTLTTPNCPSAAELPTHGGECGRRRARRARGQGQYRVGSAVGSEPHVGRGAHRAQYVVRQLSAIRSRRIT